MKNEIYRGVPLTGNRTKEMIDTVVENRDSMSTKELAKLVGFETYHPLIGMFRQLDKNKPKVIIKTAKNTFKNYYGSGKEKARALIAEAITDTKRQSSNILTLPAADWIMEKNIIKKKSGYKFTAVERDKDTFKQMIKNLSNNEELLDSVIATANKSIGEVVINDKEDTYSSTILDYCGYIDSFYDEIDDIMKRNLVKKSGYIAITLSENDRSINHPLRLTSHSNVYIQKCCVEGEEVSGAKVTNALVNNLVYNNVGYKIVKKFSYRDTTANMLLFIIRRNDE
jgi:hypothetical protein